MVSPIILSKKELSEKGLLSKDSLNDSNTKLVRKRRKVLEGVEEETRRGSTSPSSPKKNLVEITPPLNLVRPIDRNKTRIRYCYGRVRTEKLNKRILKQIFRDSNSNIDVIEDEDYFNLQYKNHKILKISKKDGFFYSKYECLSQEARIVWEILRKNGFIENPHRRTFPRSFRIEWRER